MDDATDPPVRTAAAVPPDADAATGSGRPAHTTRPLPRPTRMAAGVGVAAAVAAAGLGTAALLNAPEPTPSGARSLQAITVSGPPPATVPLSGPEIFALLDQSKDFGPLGDAQRRASCLSGLGYPAATPVLGARSIEVAGRPAVLFVLPDDKAGSVVALAVPASCSSADTGLLASTVVARP